MCVGMKAQSPQSVNRAGFGVTIVNLPVMYQKNLGCQSFFKNNYKIILRPLHRRHARPRFFLLLSVLIEPNPQQLISPRQVGMHR